MRVDAAVRTVMITGDGAFSRRLLGCTAWVVLEGLASHGREACGRIEVTMSARLLAEELGINVDTVTRALGRLQGAGVVRIERVRDGGRFAGTRWLLELSRVPGLVIAAEPCEVSPGAARANAENPIAPDGISREVAETAMVDSRQPRRAGPRRERTRSVSSLSLFEV